MIAEHRRLHSDDLFKHFPILYRWRKSRTSHSHVIRDIYREPCPSICTKSIPLRHPKDWKIQKRNSPCRIGKQADICPCTPQNPLSSRHQAAEMGRDQTFYREDISEVSYSFTHSEELQGLVTGIEVNAFECALNRLAWATPIKYNVWSFRQAAMKHWVMIHCCNPSWKWFTAVIPHGNDSLL